MNSHSPLRSCWALHAIVGFWPVTFLAPASFGTVSVWGGGNGWSDVAANWVGGELPELGNDLEVPAGIMVVAEQQLLSTAQLAIRSGATVAVMDLGLVLVGVFDHWKQPLDGTLFVGTSDVGGGVIVSGRIDFRGTGRLRLTHPDSYIAADPDPEVGTFFQVDSTIDFGGQGVIEAPFIAAGVVKADAPGGTLEIASAFAHMHKGLAENGGTLRFTGGEVKKYGDALELEARPGSTIFIAAGTKLMDPLFIQSGGTITHEGPPTFDQAQYSGDFTLPGFIIVGRTLDLRASNGHPAGRLTFSDPIALSGIIFNNDFSQALVPDGPTRMLGGEVILKGLDGFIGPLLGGSGEYGIRLEQATVRGRGVLRTGFDLTTFDSKIVADNPTNEVVTEATEAARRLHFPYDNLAYANIDNAGVLEATNGGLLDIQGRRVTNYSDGGTYPNGVPHPLGHLEAGGASRIYMAGCELHEGSVILNDAASSFTFLNGIVSGGNTLVLFNGPGEFEINARMRGQLVVTAGTTLGISEIHSSGSAIDGQVLFNGAGRYRLLGATLSGLHPTGDTLRINATLEGSGYLSEVPIFIGATGRLVAEKFNGSIMHIAAPITNAGHIVAPPGDVSLRIEPGHTVENLNDGEVLLQGPMDLYGRIKGGQIVSYSTLHSWTGTLENVTITKGSDPNNIEVSVSNALTLRGTIYNNAVMRVPEGSRINLDGPVRIDNQSGLVGRVELAGGALIDDLDGSKPKLTLGAHQTLLARRSSEQSGGVPADYRASIYVPVQNNGIIIADAMVLWFEGNPSGKGKFSAVNGGSIENLSWVQVLGNYWEQAVQAVGGAIKLTAQTGLNLRNAIMEASLPSGLVEVNSPIGIIAFQSASIVANGGGNVVANGGGNVVANGGGNVVANGGGNVVANGGGNVVANGGGNVVANGGGNVVANGGGNIVAVGGGNIVAVGGGNIVAVGGGNIVAVGGGNVVALGGGNIIANGGGNLVGRGLRSGGGSSGAAVAAADGRGHLFIGGGGDLEAPAVQLQNNSVLHLTNVAEAMDPPLAPNDTTGGQVVGNLELDAGSEMQVQIGGRAAGVSYDQLTVTGSATLAGRLNVWFLNSFHKQITPADSFTILTTGSPVTPAFSNALNGRIATSDGRGSFALATAPDGLGVVLNDFQAAAVQPWPAWLAAHALAGAAADPFNDPDGDGRVNVIEFGDGSDPRQSDGSPEPAFAVTEEQWTYTFLRYPAERSVVAYVVETSADLKTWTPLAAPATTLVRHINDQFEEVTVCVPLAEGGQERFVRSRTGLVP